MENTKEMIMLIGGVLGIIVPLIIIVRFFVSKPKPNLRKIVLLLFCAICAIVLLGTWFNFKKEKSILLKEEISPNEILNHIYGNLGWKNFIHGNSASYFSSDCPHLYSQYIDLHINFMNPSITKDIEFLRVNICRLENRNKEEIRVSVLQSFYEVRQENNLIRIINDLEKGKYEISYGFMFKNDLNMESPTFYFKRCILTKY